MADFLKRLTIFAGVVILFGSVSASVAVAGAGDYRLGVRDKLEIVVFGEPELSGEFEVEAGGWIAMPLIGTLNVAGLTVRELEVMVRDMLRNGYLKDPLVTGEVVARRPFFIDGEIERPGQYPTSQGLTVREAVALAGGFKFWANTDKALVTRQEEPGGKRRTVAMNELVRPGDYIWITD